MPKFGGVLFTIHTARIVCFFWLRTALSRACRILSSIGTIRCLSFPTFGTEPYPCYILLDNSIRIIASLAIGFAYLRREAEIGFVQT